MLTLRSASVRRDGRIASTRQQVSAVQEEEEGNKDDVPVELSMPAEANAKLLNLKVGPAAPLPLPCRLARRPWRYHCSMYPALTRHAIIHTKCSAPLPHRRSPSVSGSKAPSQSTTRAPALNRATAAAPAGRPTAVARPAPPARRHGSAQHRPGPHSHHHAACMAVSLRPLVPPQAPNGLPHPGVDTCGSSAASLAHSTAP